MEQPNGRRFKARLVAAEVGGSLEVGGYTITQRPDGWWVYALGRNIQGGLRISDARVGRDAPPKGLKRGAGREIAISGGNAESQMADIVFDQLETAADMAGAQVAQGGPRVFKFPTLMLATWWDADKGQTGPTFQPGSDTPEYFRKLLDGFGGNPRGTLTEFYFENSYGQFLVQVDVWGPYTSARSAEDPCYYGGIDPPPSIFDDLDPLDSVLGVGGGGAIGMAAEAIPQADPEVDFTQYDNDGDGDIDFLGILHSGPDMAATGDPCHTWSHAIDASLGTPVGIPTTDGVVARRLFTMPEIDLEIGVAVHEMAHALGEPDYYNPSYTSAGTGDWDIMAGGSWFGNPPGSNPTGFQPASKVFQGWIKPRIVRSTTRRVRLKPRELMPFDGYDATKANPNIVLVPTQWVKVDQEDKYGHVWTTDDVYGLVKDGKRGYVVEGYYLEAWSRSTNGRPIHKKMSRAPYFDRQALQSGLMAWHFDYFYRSNVINGSNNAGSDPNRPQMDPLEWDYNDNTQELQLNYTRGEPTDVVWSAATGITSGTRMLPPGTPKEVPGKPQEPIEFTGVLVPTTTMDHEFTVEDNPANYRMTVRVAGTGDCTLQLIKVVNGEDEPQGEPVDSAFVGGEEMIQVVQPDPGTYKARVGDFAACAQYQGSVTFESASAFVTTGAADTWSNWTEKPTGWAFTNIRPKSFQDLDHKADGSTNGAITVDILKIGKRKSDASPGFIGPKANARAGRNGISAGRRNRLSVPVFNNGGKPIRTLHVQLRRGSRVLATKVVKGLKGYSRKNVGFVFKPRTEGFQTLSVVVDPRKKVSEASEANNVQRVSVWAGPRRPRVLIVDDDGNNDSQSAYAGALASARIPYVIHEQHVSAKVMKRFRAVIWEGGLERYQGQLDVKDRRAIKKYLDSGGRLLLSSPRAAAALGETPGGTNPGATDDMPVFLKRYFGAQYLDTKQVGGGSAVGTGDIFRKKKIVFGFYPGRPLQDVFKKASFGADDKPIGKVRAVARWKKGGKDALMVLRVKGDSAHNRFRSVFMGYNLAQTRKSSDMAFAIKRVMRYFGVKSGGYRAGKKPLIYHSQMRNYISNRRVPIAAFVTKRPGNAVLHFRMHRKGPWRSKPMKRGKSRWSVQGAIPRRFVTPRGVEYYISAAGARDPGPRGIVHLIGVGLPMPER